MGVTNSFRLCGKRRGDTIGDNYMLIHLAPTSENRESEVLLAIIPRFRVLGELSVMKENQKLE
ncbi:hypothetical protein H5410_011046, partial [Solanum commersonii]